MGIPDALIVTHLCFWCLAFWLILSLRRVRTTVNQASRDLEDALSRARAQRGIQGGDQ